MSNLNMNDIDELVTLDDVAVANTFGGAKKSTSKSNGRTKSGAIEGAVVGGPVLSDPIIEGDDGGIYGEDGDYTEEFALSVLQFDYWGAS
jgi:hypothetical protein